MTRLSRLLAACCALALPLPQGAAAQRPGGTAVVSGIQDLQGMSAFSASEVLTRGFQREVLFMPLLRYDAALRPTPWLAERWDTARVGPDSLELTLRLRTDVRWHDGEPTTARDVAFTYQRTRNPVVASPLAGGFAHYSPGLQVVDGRTVRVRLRRHAEFLDPWVQLPIMPAHLLEGVAPRELAAHPFGSQRPVGNGPFRFVRRVPNQEWVFEANRAFPAALGGRPYLDRLVYRVIPDQTVQLTELLTGRVDVYLAANPSQAEQIRTSRTARLISAPTLGWAFIAWNGRRPGLQDARVRRALTLAIDRRAIVAAVMQRHAEGGRATVPPAHWAYAGADARSALPFNPAAARRLLAQAGYADRDRDGVLEDASGHPLRFTLKTPQGNEQRRDIAQVVQAQLRAVGVDVQPVVVESNTLIGQITGRPNARGERERDFDAVIMATVDNLRKDDSNHFHSRHLNGPFQISSFAHPRVDALLDTLGVILDREQARPLWREYQALLAQEAPYTVVYYPRRLVGVGRRLQGVQVDVRGDLVSVTRWHVGGGRPSAAR